MQPDEEREAGGGARRLRRQQAVGDAAVADGDVALLERDRQVVEPLFQGGTSPHAAILPVAPAPAGGAC